MYTSLLTLVWMHSKTVALEYPLGMTSEKEKNVHVFPLFSQQYKFNKSFNRAHLTTCGNTKAVLLKSNGKFSPLRPSEGKGIFVRLWQAAGSTWTCSNGIASQCGSVKVNAPFLRCHLPVLFAPSTCFPIAEWSYLWQWVTLVHRRINSDACCSSSS